MTIETIDKPEKLGTLPFVLAGVSFVPLIGVLFGIASLIWGLRTRKAGGRLLALIGVAGIAFTVVLYGSLFYFGFQQRGGVYDELRVRLAQGTVNSLVPAVEFYRIQNGTYPETLEVLAHSLPKDALVPVFDPTVVDTSARSRYFFYKRVGDDNYYLRGLGPDGLAFTADDIVPQIPAAPDSKLGLLINRK